MSCTVQKKVRNINSTPPAAPKYIELELELELLIQEEIDRCGGHLYVVCCDQP